jgi:hypothetical protein
MPLATKVEESLEDFVNDSRAIVDGAKRRGIELRILGALSCYLHLKELYPDAAAFYQGLGRLADGSTFTDLDLIGYKKERRKIMEVLEKDLGLKPDLRFMALYGNERLLYHKDGKFSIDVFLDRLDYSHVVDFKGRLELDYPTISVTDLVLEKLQIHQINRKDLIDLVVTFLFHDVQNGFERDVVDSAYISSVLSSDWGFWYDATNNLGKASQMCQLLQAEGKLTEEQRIRAETRIAELLRRIEGQPKTNDWIKRSRAGTSKPWYRDVEEIVR